MVREEKSSESGGGSNFFVDSFFWLLLVLVLLGFINFLLGKIGFSFSELPSFSSLFFSFFNMYQVFAVFISLVFLLGIIYSHVKLGEILNHHHGHETHHAYSHSNHVPQKRENKRWMAVTERINSNSESNWRLAILECDIILDEMLTQMGYVGDTIADKLKQIEPSDFLTLNEAWEGHKIRNRIAHGGLGESLSRSEAERAYKLFEKVFKEFHFI